jgi:membrane-bound lytic murein transglycosylase MltF
MKNVRLLAAALLGLTVACGGSTSNETTPPPAASSPAAAPSSTPAPAPATPPDDPKDALPPPPESPLPAELRRIVDQTFSGDFDQMVSRRIIRAGVPFNRTFFFIDKGTPRGLSYEYLTLFEESLNKQLKTGNLKVHLVMVPMPAGSLLPALRDGKIDMVVAQLTVTPARQQLVDFSMPTRRNVNEVVVTGPQAQLASLDSLSGREVFVRRSSSYFESLTALNERLKAERKEPVNIQAASESLQDDDLLEMVNAGLIPAIVVDDYLANFWQKVLPGIRVHQDLKLRTGGALAVAIRKNSPKFASTLNGYIQKVGLDSATGAILNKRYLQSTQYVKNATSEKERKKFLALLDLFKTYGDRYKFDYLLMAAQGYQESRLEQNAKSHVGAIGVMQLMPQTGKEQNVGDIRKVEPNVHAGVKYMRFIRNQYFENEPMDDLNKGLFTFAAYNAGPGRIRQLRRETAARGLDPNVWFGNVERLASERIGRETVTYVSNIYKYYLAYRLAVARIESRKAAGAGRP